MCYTTKCGKNCHTGKIDIDQFAQGNDFNPTSATAPSRNGVTGTCRECGVYATFVAGSC